MSSSKSPKASRSPLTSLLLAPAEAPQQIFATERRCRHPARAGEPDPRPSAPTSPWCVHRALDTLAGVALLAAPFLLGFEGIPRAFFVGVADLRVVAASDRRATDALEDFSAGAPASKAA